MMNGCFKIPKSNFIKSQSTKSTSKNIQTQKKTKGQENIIKKSFNLSPDILLSATLSVLSLIFEIFLIMKVIIYFIYNLKLKYLMYIKIC